MSTANLDSANLKAQLSAPGLIRESVMEKIWDISKIPLPLTDLIGRDTHDNEYCEWTEEALAAQDLANNNVDGQDATGNDVQYSRRVGNHSQISDKTVRVSYRANASNSVGSVGKLSRQVSRRQQELRRDVEGIAFLGRASRADTGVWASAGDEDTNSGLVGGLPSWLATNTSNLTTPVGFDTSTKLTTKPVAAAHGVALTESTVRDVVESIHEQGGDPTVMMSIPKIIRKFSEYLFTSSARVAGLMSDQGKSKEKATALGSVSVFVTDFAVLKLISNRLQPKFATGYDYSDQAAGDAADVFIMDPMYLKLSYLKGYRVDPLAKTGLADNRQMCVDWTLNVLNEKAQGIIAAVDFTADVTP